jgi:hypothetical protein
MYKITIVTKNGHAAVYRASTEMFKTFRGWLIGGESSAEALPEYYGTKYPLNVGFAGAVHKPCGTFLFEGGAVIKDNIDTVSWTEEEVALKPPQKEVFMLDEFIDRPQAAQA